MIDIEEFFKIYGIKIRFVDKDENIVIFRKEKLDEIKVDFELNRDSLVELLKFIDILGYKQLSITDMKSINTVGNVIGNYDIDKYDLLVIHKNIDKI